MKDFTASLLREKFLIFDPKLETSSYEPVKAMSNRIQVDLRDDNGKLLETYIIRTHTMHSCARFAARVIQSFEVGGALMEREEPFQWDAAWDAVSDIYDSYYNDSRWACVYHEGKVIFENGERHALLDVIENCDYQSDDEYDYAIPAAENAFKAMGKVVKIEQESHVALAVSCEEKQARFGIILRAANGTTTFTFSVHATGKRKINIPQCLNAAAAFLEGIQLAFTVGMNAGKIQLGLVDAGSPEEKQTRDGRKHLSRLSAEIASLESSFGVRYRPDKPEFHKLAAEAEMRAHRMLGPSNTTLHEEDEVKEEKSSDGRSSKLPPRTKSAQNSKLD